MPVYEPLGTLSQHNPSRAHSVLYLRQDACAGDLFDAAEYRQGALLDLLAALSLNENDGTAPDSLPRAARALMLLAADAQALYTAALQRHR